MKRFIIKSELDFNDVFLHLETYQDVNICALRGGLGAGKTTLVKELLRYKKSKEQVSSPTYAIINEYDTPSSIVYHMDLYRLNKMEEALEIGIEEYLDSGHLCLIEWPDLISDILPLPYIDIEIIPRLDESREVIVRRVA